jgi:PucR family transcriptional regulator, purine catabolism regulatory protein
VLDAIVSGELTGSELARRLAPFGLSDRVAAIVLRRAGEGRGAGTSVETALWAALREEAAPALVASVGSLACALVPGGGSEDELFGLGDRVAAAAGVELGGEVRVGIGRAVPTVDARRSFHEARCALEALALGEAVPENGNGSAPPAASEERPRVATYKDLGSFQLLLSLQDDEALRLFCDSILGPIEASEGPYGGELMRSLEAFIEENGQWERAARRLYCHRHTLRYRIRRVEELTGRNLGSARDRIEFWLALRGRQLVS